MKGYIYLSISILTEVFATTMLKLSAGFTVLLPSLGVIAGYLISFYCLSLCLRTVPLSLAYAIWSGVGTALVALIGILVWNEVLTMLKALGMILIIGGVLMLNTTEQGDGPHV